MADRGAPEVSSRDHMRPRGEQRGQRSGLRRHGLSRRCLWVLTWLACEMGALHGNQMIIVVLRNG